MGRLIPVFRLLLIGGCIRKIVKRYLPHWYEPKSFFTGTVRTSFSSGGQHSITMEVRKRHKRRDFNYFINKFFLSLKIVAKAKIFSDGM